MALDDKDELKDNEIHIQGELEIDPSSVKIKSDGSMPEPSFSSDKDNNEEEILDDDSEEEVLSDEEAEELQNEALEDDNIEKLDDEMSKDEEKSEKEESSDSEEEKTDESSKEEPSEKEETIEDSSEEKESSSDGEEVSSEDSSKESEEETSSKEESKESETEETPSSDSEASNEKEDVSEDTGKEESPKEEDTIPENKEPENAPQTEDDKPFKEDTGDSSDKNLDNKKNEDSGDSKSPKDGKDKASDAAKDKAKDASDAAKDKAKDTADAAKDKAKDAADAAKDKVKDAAKDKIADAAKDKAKDAAKNNSVANKAKIADDTKEALKKGPKGLAGAPGIRAALNASENTNVYSKIGASVVRVLDAVLGKEKTDQILDKVGMEAIKSAIAGIAVGLFSALLPILLIAIMIYSIFAPMLDALKSVEQVAINLADTAEKFRNLYINGNFGDSKTVFYKELDSLGKIYGDDLEASLLMATTFYTDMRNGYQTRYDNTNDLLKMGAKIAKTNGHGVSEERKRELYIESFTDLIEGEIEKLHNEADSTYDAATGLTYTTGKVFRLKFLANAMFDQTLGGNASNYNVKETTLPEWFKMYSEQFREAVKRVMSDIIQNFLNSIVKSIEGLISTFEDFFSLDFESLAEDVVAAIQGIIDECEEALLHIEVLVNCVVLGAMSLKSITLDIEVDDKNLITILESYFNFFSKLINEFLEEGTIDLSFIKLNYYTYKYNEDNYKKYLKEEYLPKNPDYKPFLTFDSKGKPLDASLDYIIEDIFDYKKYFDKLFVEEDEDTEDYSELCLGAIDPDLANALGMPVDIDSSHCMEFLNENAYGYSSSGALHNGIEINEKSTGNKEGDNVYAVYDGGVVKDRETSAGGTMECRGGCIEIYYEATINNKDYKFSIVYKGLSKDSITHVIGDTVNKGDIVGKIGSADDSELQDKPSLYIEFRKEDGTAIDPTNLIVKCSSGTVKDYPGATSQDVPQSFNQGTGYTATCLRPDGFDWGCDNAGDIYVAKDSDVYPIYDLWFEQGHNYKNGLAYITVDGVDRYLLGTVRTFGKVGDVINFTLENGYVIPAVLFDEKSLNDNNIYYVDDVPWGHEDGSYVSVIEFEVNTDDYIANGPSVNSNSAYNIDWDSSSPIVSFTNNGNLLDGSFDLSGTGSSSGTTTNLKYCDSMYPKDSDTKKASHKGSGNSGSYGPTEYTEVVYIDYPEKDDFVVLKTNYGASVDYYAWDVGQAGLTQGANSGSWGDCCWGFAQTHSCGMITGDLPSVSNLEQCNGPTLSGCAKLGHLCTEDMDEYLDYVVSNIMDGHPVVIQVSSGYKGNDEYSRHFVTAIGFRNSGVYSQEDILIMDSWDAEVYTLGGRRKLQGPDDVVIVNNACGNDYPYESGNYAEPWH